MTPPATPPATPPTLTRSGDLVSCPSGAVWPDRCVCCNAPEAERAQITVYFQETRRNISAAVLVAMLLLFSIPLVKTLGCVPLLLAMLPLLLAPARRRLEVGVCVRHRWRQIARVWMFRAAAVLLVVGGGLFCLELYGDLWPSGGLLGTGCAAVVLVARAVMPQLLKLRHAGADRLLLEADRAFLLSLPPDPDDLDPAALSAARRHAWLPEATEDALISLPLGVSPEPPSYRDGPVAPLNPFTALPVDAPPPLEVAVVYRDGRDVVAPPGAVWPDRCICCGKAEDLNRVPLYLLPLPFPFGFLSLPLGRLFSPVRPPVAMVALCSTHGALRWAGRLLLAMTALGCVAPLFASKSTGFDLLCLGMFTILPGLHLLDAVRLKGIGPQGWRLRLSEAFTAALPVIRGHSG